MVFQIEITFDDDSKQRGKAVINAENPDGELDNVPFATVTFYNQQVGTPYSYDEICFKQEYINEEYPDYDRYYLFTIDELKRRLETFYEILSGTIYTYC